MVLWVIRSILHGGPIELFLIAFNGQQLVWTKAMVCAIMSGMVHIKETLLLMGKNSPYSGSSRFLFSLSEWSFTICPYYHK